MREVRGVFYTPEPAVNYIVRSIDWLLKTRLGRLKGLADEDTLILDTATFLYFVIDLIHQGFRKQLGAWDGYVVRHLLPRIFGFELLMAPYAVAHLKLSMLLEQTGYTFGSDQRLGIYLTNTLEEAAKKSEMLLGQFVSREADAAAEIKRERPIMVVLGNPPYSGHSANKGEWITVLVRDYYQVDGHPLGERNPKWLQDDYVKFIRFAEWRINQTGEGVLGYITNHGYLDNPTFRGMRQHLMQTFDEIYVLDLHGNSKKKEKSPDGEKDENVFDIQQGVAILLAVKTATHGESKSKPAASVYHTDLWGRREIYEGEQLVGGKYQWLWQNSAETTSWQELNPSSPFYLFKPYDTELRTEYEKGWSIIDAMPMNLLGFQTHRDPIAVAFDKGILYEQVTHFLGSPPSAGDWSLLCQSCDYRPFDERFVFLHKNVTDRPRLQVVAHLFHSNLALNVTRQTRVQTWQHAFASKKPTPAVFIEIKDGSSIFPLYLYPAADELDITAGRRPNLGPKFLKALARSLKVPQEGPGGLPKGVTPEDVFHYTYSIFHSPMYRTRYAAFLKIDFPRLPVTGKPGLFFNLAALGSELVGLHLVESQKLNDLITEFPEKGTDAVEKVRYTDKDKRVWINPIQYFGNVPAALWNFHIGGYQVCEKWLKDRKGRTLTYEDIQHYQKIIVALKETIRLMTEIDKLIETQGGWPGAFSGNIT
jgi:predicted helicase